MQSRLEEEEEAKAALMSRIQRLTKLILVSTKNTIPGLTSDIPGHQHSHSIGDDAVSYSFISYEIKNELRIQFSVFQVTSGRFVLVLCLCFYGLSVVCLPFY